MAVTLSIKKFLIILPSDSGAVQSNITARCKESS
jgi:hypothetical protein